MPVEQTNPVLVVLLSALAVLLIASQVWLLLTLRRSYRLSIRTLDMLSDLAVAIAGLEQALHANGASPQQLASSISGKIRKPGFDIDALLSDVPPRST